MFELSTIDSAVGSFPVSKISDGNEEDPPGVRTISPMSIESDCNSPREEVTTSGFHYDDTEDNASYSGQSWYAAGATATMMADSDSDASSVRSRHSWSFKSVTSMCGGQSSTTASPTSSVKSNTSQSSRSSKRSFLKKKKKSTTTNDVMAVGNKENNLSQQQKHPLYNKVKNLIERVMPNETNNVDEMMMQFEGREDELIMTLEAMVVDDTPPPKPVKKRPLKNWVAKQKKQTKNSTINKQQQQQKQQQSLASRSSSGTPPKPPRLAKKPPLPPSAKKSKRPNGSRFSPRGGNRKPPLDQQQHGQRAGSTGSLPRGRAGVAALSSSSHTNSSRLTASSFADDKSFFSAAESMTEIQVPTNEATTTPTKEETSRQEVVTDLEHFIERGNWDAVRSRAANVEIKADLEEEIEDVLSNATTLTSNSSMSQNMKLQVVSPAAVRGSDTEFTAEMEMFLENNDWAGVVDAVKRLEQRLSQVQQENEALKRGDGTTTSSNSVLSDNTISKLCDAVTPLKTSSMDDSIAAESINSRSSSVGGESLRRLFESDSSSVGGESLRRLFEGNSPSTKESVASHGSHTTKSKGRSSTVAGDESHQSRQTSVHASYSMASPAKTKEKSVTSSANGSNASSSGSGVLDMFLEQSHKTPMSPENGLDLVFHHKNASSPMSLLTSATTTVPTTKKDSNAVVAVVPPEEEEEIENHATLEAPPVSTSESTDMDAPPVSTSESNDMDAPPPPQEESIRDLHSKLALALPSNWKADSDNDDSTASAENDDDMSMEIARLDSVTNDLRNELEQFDATETSSMFEELNQSSTEEETESTTDFANHDAIAVPKAQSASTSALKSVSKEDEISVEGEVPGDALEMYFQKTPEEHEGETTSSRNHCDENTIASSSTKSAIVIQNNQTSTTEIHIIQDDMQEGGEVYEETNKENHEDDAVVQQLQHESSSGEKKMKDTQLADIANTNETDEKSQEVQHLASTEVRNTLVEITQLMLNDTKKTTDTEQEKVDTVNETIEVKQMAHSSPPPQSNAQSKPSPKAQKTADTGCACIIL